MNYLHIAKAVIGFYFFMKRHTRNHGEPVTLTQAECDRIYDNIRSERFTSCKFALSMDIRTLNFPFVYNIEKFLPFKNNFTIDAYFRAIHPDYIIDYIRWAEATYSCILTDLRSIAEPLKHNYRITIPMKLLDGKYHWLLMNCVSLQLDKHQNIITHLNTYTVVRPFQEGENTPLVGNLSGENLDEVKWNLILTNMYCQRQPFVLTPEQNKIVELLINNTTLSNAEIAELLHKKKNTIDAQNKQILERARTAFTDEHFENIKEVVSYLKNMQCYNESFFATYPAW